MARGKVKWFDEAKGFGFIESDDGDVFIHFSEIDVPGYKTLCEGQQVEYLLQHTKKGLSAIHCKPVASPQPQQT